MLLSLALQAASPEDSGSSAQVTALVASAGGLLASILTVYTTFRARSKAERAERAAIESLASRAKSIDRGESGKARSVAELLAKAARERKAAELRDEGTDRREVGNEVDVSISSGSGQADDADDWVDYTFTGPGLDAAQVDTPPLVDDDGTSEKKATYYLEHHRAAVSQQKVSFYASLVLGAVAAILVLVGAAIVVLTGQDAGTITALFGALPAALSGLLFFQSRDAGKRSDESARQLAKSVEQGESTARAMKIANSLRDQTVKEKLLGIAALQLIFPDAVPSQLGSILERQDERKAIE
ncbi:hypothetical protein [Actinomycetospora sp. NBRC 106378]|uniref:TRADD-N-associated membrane domain-containing protein n=1 Tax=Actinomycetospora sp. NBRC 106378 TaxID=3032208 RepID=UPI0024A32524|nr:hypothetical protein [Actinomycetospora sp. NBRC 106378]GLZ56392.1 hypothetical protein Acsp07_60090 [Actinomycetospora sp. NBRC 106378]